MSIKCGKGHEHGSVSEVRACYAVSGSAGTEVATDKQVKFLGSLLSRSGAFVSSNEQLCTMPKNVASLLIDGMLRFGKGGPLPAGVSLRPAESGSTDFPDVPAGHYAVKSATGNNDLDFFRVDRPEDGPWAGRTFVKRVIGGRPSAPVHGTGARAALQAILDAGVDASRTLYGQQIGQCWRCNRHLTDEVSRQLGIGPVCREG